MENLIHLLQQQVAKAVLDLYQQTLSPDTIQISSTPAEYDGDLTIVGFPLVRFSKKKPEETAAELGAYLTTNMPYCTGFNVVKGFCNLNIHNDYWLKLIADLAVHGAEWGQAPAKDETVIVEYCSPNTNKPLHLGHVRNILIGYATAEILKKAGYNVITTQVINDRGIHICKSMLAWEQFGNGETPQSAGIKGDHLIGKYYVLFETKFREEYKAWQTTPAAAEVLAAWMATPAATKVSKELEAKKEKDPIIQSLIQKFKEYNKRQSIDADEATKGLLDVLKEEELRLERLSKEYKASQDTNEANRNSLAEDSHRLVQDLQEYNKRKSTNADEATPYLLKKLKKKKEATLSLVNAFKRYYKQKGSYTNEGISNFLNTVIKEYEVVQHALQEYNKQRDTDEAISTVLAKLEKNELTVESLIHGLKVDHKDKVNGAYTTTKYYEAEHRKIESLINTFNDYKKKSSFEHGRMSNFLDELKKKKETVQSLIQALEVYNKHKGTNADTTTTNVLDTTIKEEELIKALQEYIKLKGTDTVTATKKFLDKLKEDEKHLKQEVSFYKAVIELTYSNYDTTTTLATIQTLQSLIKAIQEYITQKGTNANTGKDKLLDTLINKEQNIQSLINAIKKYIESQGTDADAATSNVLGTLIKEKHAVQSLIKYITTSNFLAELIRDEKSINHNTNFFGDFIEYQGINAHQDSRNVSSTKKKEVQALQCLIEYLQKYITDAVTSTFLDYLIKDELADHFFKEVYKNTYFNTYSTLGTAAKNMLEAWEAQDPHVRELWEKMNNWVYEGFSITHATLGIHFDKNYYESQTYLLGKEQIEKGLASGAFFRKEDSSVWVDLKDVKLDEKLLIRSNGTSVYITQDMGMAPMRYADYKMNKMIYVVGDEQEYHFKVLFEVLRRLEEPFAAGLFHLSYGMVELTTGKMKSREGTVVDADDLIKDIVDEVSTESAARDTLANLSEEERKEIWRKIGLGALKFYMLKVHPRQKMIFDPKQSIDLQGQTGPYIQNAYVRTQAVQRRAQELTLGNAALHTTLEPAERHIARLLLDYPATILKAADTYNAAEVANYAYELARAYHKFWAEVSILRSAPDAAAFRMDLSKAVAAVLSNAMSLLGIEMPDKM